METDRILIETSVLIKYFRTSKRQEITLFEKAIERFNKCFLSVITVYEIELGAARAGRLSDLQNVLPYVNILPIDFEIANRTSRLHSDLIGKNRDIGIKDVFIAATSLVYNIPILTYNRRHFARTPVEIIELSGFS